MNQLPPPDPQGVATSHAATPERPSRRGVGIGLVAGLLGGTAAGLVLGVPGLTSATDDAIEPAALVQQVEDDTNGDEPGDDTTEAPDAERDPGARLLEVLQPLVDDGTLTAEQADAVVAQLVENKPEDGRHRKMGGAFRLGIASEAVTDLLGLTPDELREQLRSGATLAEVATANGVDPQAVVDELVAELTERVDTAVENGRLDESEATEKLADAEEKITDLVNNGRPERGERPGGPPAPDAED